MAYRTLRSAWRHTKGCRIGHRLRELKWELRYAWQRAWRGYDDTDVFELGYNFTSLMPVLLREFRNHTIALLPDPDHPERPHTEEETRQILDEMIACFENCDEDVVWERIAGSSLSELPDDAIGEHTKNVAEEMWRSYQRAMELFSKYAWHLWY